MKRCFHCGPYDGEGILVKNTWHAEVYCCRFCCQEYSILCPLCNTLYMPYWGRDAYIKACRRCEAPSEDVLAEAERLYKIERREAQKVRSNLDRASKLGLAATLTPKGWCKTLRDFDYKCAYCLTSPYEHLDHFIPVCEGGGTWQYNCVPACKTCNYVKGWKHPEKCRQITSPFCEEDILRVNRYLYDNWQLSLKK